MEKLDEPLEEVLRFAAANSQNNINLDDVARHLDVSQVRAEHFLDRLRAIEYVGQVPGYSDYYLLESGRAYIVEHDLDT